MKKGFTLLEIIIVIIIIGVLTALALPKMFTMIEGTRATEAISSMATIRSAMERCYIMNNGSYSDCVINVLDIEDPSSAPNAHFKYEISWRVNTTVYCLTATRNTVDGGDSQSRIVMCIGASCDVGLGSSVCTVPVSGVNWSATAIYKAFVPK